MRRPAVLMPRLGEAHCAAAPMPPRTPGLRRSALKPRRERGAERVRAGPARARPAHLRELSGAADRAAAHEALAEEPVRELLREPAARQGPRVRLHLDRAPERVTIDPEHLDTAVGNLIRERAPPRRRRSGRRHGRVRRRPAGRERARPRPRDAPGDQARLFERFFTTTRDHGGTGLGLAITRAIAERRGGDVTFTIGPTGTTFVLRV